MLSLGIRDDDDAELREDFAHLRRWRKSVEQVQSYTVRAVIAAIVGGVIGAFWMGGKALIGK